MLQESGEKFEKPSWVLELESLSMCLLAIPSPPIIACALRLAMSVKRVLALSVASFPRATFAYYTDVLEEHAVAYLAARCAPK